MPGMKIGTFFEFLMVVYTLIVDIAARTIESIPLVATAKVVKFFSGLGESLKMSANW